jgi:hypothetical protein
MQVNLNYFEILFLCNKNTKVQQISIFWNTWNTRLTYFQASIALGRNYLIVYDVPLPHSRARRLSWYVAADADIPLDNAAMFRMW